jgi:hypothetical protein
MTTIIQCKDKASFKVTNDITFDDVTVIMQDKDEADDMLYRLLAEVIKGE